MNSTTLQQLFEEICEFKMTRYQAQSKRLVLARAVWHNDFTPNLILLKEEPSVSPNSQVTFYPGDIAWTA